MLALYGNAGLDFFASFYGKDLPTFYDIPEADTVYGLVSELRKKAAPPFGT